MIGPDPSPDLLAYNAYLRATRELITHEEYMIEMLASMRHFAETYAVDYAEADEAAHAQYMREA